MLKVFAPSLVEVSCVISVLVELIVVLRGVSTLLLWHRLERLDYLAQKFKSKCDSHEEWATGKDDMLRNKDYKNCRLNELKVSTWLVSVITWLVSKFHCLQLYASFVDVVHASVTL